MPKRTACTVVQRTGFRLFSAWMFYQVETADSVDANISTRRTLTQSFQPECSIFGLSFNQGVLWLLDSYIFLSWILDRQCGG